MNWDFHPEALDEYEAAAAYYGEHDPDLQLRFVEAIEDAIDHVLESPTRWRVIDEDIRRYVTHVFPYGILYTIERDFVLIIAVISAESRIIGRIESHESKIGDDRVDSVR